MSRVLSKKEPYEWVLFHKNFEKTVSAIEVKKQQQKTEKKTLEVEPNLWKMEKKKTKTKTKKKVKAAVFWGRTILRYGYIFQTSCLTPYQKLIWIPLPNIPFLIFVKFQLFYPNLTPAYKAFHIL